MTAGTTLSFNLSRRSRVDLRIYSIDGRQIARLIEGEYPAGSYAIVWDGRNAAGRAVSPGSYYARLVSEEGESEQRIVRIR
jgi:flagellar hook assembly protein FlgD